MGQITNHFLDMKVWDLDRSADRGPYLVTQSGVAPDDPCCREKTFVLRPDGCWVDLNVYLGSGKPESLDAVVFPTMDQVVSVVGRLPGAPQVIDLPVEKAGLRDWLRSHPQGTLMHSVDAWLAGYKQRQGGRSEPTGTD